MIDGDNGVVDEAFLRRYRELLDAEQAAFDELEHAIEDGDRAHFETDLLAWKRTLERRTAFLERHRLALQPVSS
ncbi:MAG TPA: hypothetical protein VFF40_07530 [Acidimicrobiia bacterium]|nr:hypothetical protein [Acidimicrobiia bacterium]